jgi:hypothetical protein
LNSNSTFRGQRNQDIFSLARHGRAVSMKGDLGYVIHLSMLTIFISRAILGRTRRAVASRRINREHVSCSFILRQLYCLQK